MLEGAAETRGDFCRENCFTGQEFCARKSPRYLVWDLVTTVATRREPQSSRKCLDNRALRESC